MTRAVERRGGLTVDGGAAWPEERESPLCVDFFFIEFLIYRIDMWHTLDHMIYLMIVNKGKTTRYWRLQGT